MLPNETERAHAVPPHAFAVPVLAVCCALTNLSPTGQRHTPETLADGRVLLLWRSIGKASGTAPSLHAAASFARNRRSAPRRRGGSWPYPVRDFFQTINQCLSARREGILPAPGDANWPARSGQCKRQPGEQSERFIIPRCMFCQRGYRVGLAQAGANHRY